MKAGKANDGLELVRPVCLRVIPSAMQSHEVNLFLKFMGIPTRETFQRLEPCEVKVSSTVLRGGGAGNSASLPDNTILLRKENIE